jgi:hypothetical protein
MGNEMFNESEAIDVATEFLNEIAPDRDASADVSATHVFGKELLKRQQELREFCHQSRIYDESLIANYFRECGLTEDHWLVAFHHVEEPGTASTLPPTMVMVYDKDRRAELKI